MLMPETAVNKYDFASCREHQIGSAGKVFTIQAIAITHSVDVTSNHDLQSSVSAGHRFHNPAAGCLFRLRHHQADQLILHRQRQGCNHPGATSWRTEPRFVASVHITLYGIYLR